MSSSPFAPLDTSSPSSSSSNPRRVAYYYDPDVGNYVYYLGHPMKPHRIRMAHNLIVNYGLADEESFDAPEPSGEGSRALNANGGLEGVDGTPSGMEVDGMDPAEKKFELQTLTGSRGRAMQAFRPKRATKLDMTKFHTDEYIDLLEHVNPDNAEVLTGNGTRCERLHGSRWAIFTATATEERPCGPKLTIQVSPARTVPPSKVFSSSAQSPLADPSVGHGTPHTPRRLHPPWFADTSQPQHTGSTRARRTSRSTGRVVCTTRRRQRRAGSAMSTICEWALSATSWVRFLSSAVPEDHIADPISSVLGILELLRYVSSSSG